MPTKATFACISLSVIVVSGCSRDLGAARREYLERGDRYLKEKNFDAAVLEYRNAVQRDPRDGEVYRKLSAAYLEKGDVRSALRAATTAADLMPDTPDAQVEAGNLLLATGAFGDAKARAQKALSKSPDHVEVRILLGNALAGLEDADRAIKEFEEAIRLDPSQSASYIGLGTLRGARGDREAAEEAFKQALARDPKSALARLALAQFYWSTGRLDAAEHTLLDALAIDPDDRRANIALAVFYEYTGRGDEAEPYLLIAQRSDSSGTAALMLADYYIRENRLAEATSLLRRISSDPKSGFLSSLRLAAIADLQGRSDEALETLDRLLAAQPRNSIALAAKADLLRRRGRFDDALRAADGAIGADPLSAQAQFIRGQILEAKGRAGQALQAFNRTLDLNPRASAAQVELARLRLDSGAAEGSVALAADAVRTDPENLDARLVLARALTLRHDYAQAESTLRELLRVAPRAAAVHGQLGLLLAMKNDAPGARQAFERALALDPFELDAVGGLTALDFGAARRTEAIARLDGLLNRAPGNAGLLLITARAYASVSDLTRAETLLVRAIEADPGALAAYSMLGSVYLAEKRLDAARGQFEKLAQSQDRPVGALTVVGIIYLLQNRTADARQAFERVLGIEPHAPVAANNLAWIYAENGGNLDLALQLAQTASEALPDQAEVSDTLGWIYYKKQMMPRAVSALRHSLDLDPKNALASYHLGLALEKSGDVGQARRMLELSLTLDPASGRSADVKRRLASLGT
jgi:putative PEP-CTERM system TPR-repeat lipoprotein